MLLEMCEPLFESVIMAFLSYIFEISHGQRTSNFLLLQFISVMTPLSSLYISLVSTYFVGCFHVFINITPSWMPIAEFIKKLINLIFLCYVNNAINKVGSACFISYSSVTNIYIYIYIYIYIHIHTYILSLCLQIYKPKNK